MSDTLLCQIVGGTGDGWGGGGGGGESRIKCTEAEKLSRFLKMGKLFLGHSLIII